MTAPTQTGATGIEAQVCEDIAARQRVGLAKYGMTVAANPLRLREWLQYAYEECLDQAIYLKAALAAFDRSRTKHMTATVVEYVEAIGRNPGEQYQHSHLYAVDAHGNYLPMCRFGWNRSNGTRLSIFRGYSGSKGTCKTCSKRREAGLPGVEAKANSHKTKWL